MKLLEGKTPAERNKIIAAALLGLVALIALYLAFGRGSSTTATTKTLPTPTPKVVTGSNQTDNSLPPPAQQDFVYQSTPVVYQPGNAYAPDAGRNIFAFYEPQPPCVRDCPTPVPIVVAPKPATPAPTPPVFITSVSPQSVYAGSRGFRLEVTGERFTPDAHIYFSQTELPTTFVNSQKLVADIPANFIAQEGPKQIITQTPDGKVYSNQMMLTVEAPPRPSVQYIGMIGRKRYNNDTAVFEKSGQPGNFSARLNDVVEQRFRLVAISPADVVFQDVDLGFKHRIPITKPGAPGGPPTKGVGGGQPSEGGFVPFDPAGIPTGDIPGIPNNIQRYNPSQPPSPMMESAPQKKNDKNNDVDDGDGDG